MVNPKRLLKSVNILNLLLMTAIALSSLSTVSPLFNMHVDITVPEVKELLPDREDKPPSYQSLSLADFIIVAEQNVFHPERRVVVDKKGEQAVSKPELILYGTLITHDTHVAYVEDKKSPYSTPGRANRQVALNKGDVIGGFVLKEIEAEQITLVRGEEKMIVTLYENKARKPGEASSKISPAHTSAPMVPPSAPQSPGQMRRPPVPVAVQPPRI